MKILFKLLKMSQELRKKTTYMNTVYECKNVRSLKRAESGMNHTQYVSSADGVCFNGLYWVV